jgi:FixJ family two-component response regulator
MSLEAGAIDFIAKPFARAELIACVRSALPLPRPMREHVA